MSTWSNDVEGVRGLLMDIHGYGGFEWDSISGSPFIQWGYDLSKDILDPSIFSANLDGQVNPCLNFSAAATSFVRYRILVVVPLNVFVGISSLWHVRSYLKGDQVE